MHFFGKHSLSLLLVLSLCTAGISADFPCSNLGIPFIQHYNKGTYHAGIQNWGFSQDEVGRIYVANNEGLLVFDGINWQRYPLPNRTIVRSLRRWTEGRILVGGQNELGYFAPDAQGRLRYHSLKALIPAEARDFADVWDIFTRPEGIYWRTSQYLLRYDGKQMHLIEPGAEIRYAQVIEDQLCLQLRDRGLWTVQGDHLSEAPVIGAATLGGALLIRAWPQGPDWIFATMERGLFRWSGSRWTPFPGSHPQFWLDHQIGAALPLSDGRVAIGTNRGGIALIDSSGRLRQVIDQTDGLQDNNVLSLFLDRDQQLWVGLNYGLDRLHIQSPYRRLYPDGDLQGTAYAAMRHEGRLYFGTSSALYTLPWRTYYDPTQPNPWQLVPGTEGQVWGLQAIDGQLWMGHHNGAYLVEGEAARLIPGTQGVWTFLAPQQHPDHLIMGTYQGLKLLRRDQGPWQSASPVAGFGQSSRFLVQDNHGILWVSHPYQGVFRLRLSDDLQRVEVNSLAERQGLPSPFYNHVFALNGEAIVAGERNLYHYDAEQQCVVPHPDFAGIFDDSTRVIRLVEGPDEHVWYITDREVGVLWVDTLGLQRDIEREAIHHAYGQLVGGFEMVYPMGAQRTLYGLEKGFLSYTPIKRTPRPEAWQALVAQVWPMASDSGLCYGGYSPSRAESFTFASDQDAFRFVCGATDFEAPAKLAFRYRLEGLEEQWSAWTSRSEREYTNLAPGGYTFWVQARNQRGELSQVDAFAFHISPPWYASPLAIGVYLVALLGFLGGLIWVPQRKFEQEKAQLQSAHQREQARKQEVIQAKQSELLSLQQEKLEADLRHQAQQLATATLHLVQKNEAIGHLRRRVEQLLKRYPDHPGQQELKVALRELSQEEQFEADWQQFATHFDQVHAGFLRRLQKQYAELTPKDTRLCAYLRMNLSTKEIAPLMNISVRGVEISRYRLRKKLNLDTDTNLNDFMMNF